MPTLHSDATVQRFCSVAHVTASSATDLGARLDLSEILAPVLDDTALMTDNDCRQLLLELVAAPTNPLVLESVTETVLGRPRAAAGLSADLVDQWLDLAKRRLDLLGGIALEASTRLALADEDTRYTLLSYLQRMRRQPPPINDEFAYRLVRVAGAVGEHLDSAVGSGLLTHLLSYEAVAHDAAFELGILQLRQAFATTDNDLAEATLLRARQYFADAQIDEDRPDAAAFGAALDAILAFSHGQTAAPEVLTRLKTAIVEIRLGNIGLPPSWRRPRYDALTAWLQLLLDLEQAHTATTDDAWLHAADLIGALIDVYTSHRTLQLMPAPHGVADDITPAQQQGLHSVLAPQVQRLLRVHDANGALLEAWLRQLSDQPPTDTNDAIVREQAAALLEVITAGTEPPPKVGNPASPQLAGFDIDLTGYPELAARVDILLQAREAARPVDEHPIIGQAYEDIRAQLRSQCPNQYTGLFAVDIDVMLLRLLRFMHLRLTETQKFGGDARAYLRHIPRGGARPLEKELGKDLRDFLNGVGLKVFLEETNVGGGRLDISWHPHDERITLELKRDWEDPDWDALADKFLPQAMSYLIDSPAIVFLIVLDLTDKPDGLAALSACHHVRTAPGPAGDPRSRTVVLLRVQGNKRDPSSL